MNETNYKKQLIKLLIGYGWAVQAHEDSYALYIPDLSISGFGVDGWIELKYVQHPPKTLNHIHHWTVGQQNWLISRGRMGSGNCFLLVGCLGEHNLWRHDVLKQIRHNTWTSATRAALINADSPGELCRRLSGAL